MERSEIRGGRSRISLQPASPCCSVSAPAASEDPPAGDAANGKRLFVVLGCFECHGRVGQGDAYTGPTPVLAKTALPAEAFVAFIREPPNDMPAYAASVLPDKAAAGEEYSDIE